MQKNQLALISLFSFFLLLINVLEVSADDIYTPMLTEEAVWTQVTNGGFWEPYKYYDYQKYALRGTMEVEGVVYQKMYVSYDSPTFDPCNAEFVFAMREEDKKIWIYIPEIEGELPYLDFGLEVGESTFVLGINTSYSGPLPSQATVLEKDSILVGEEYRDRLQVSLDCGVEYWIEGVGGTMGFLRECTDYYIADAPFNIFACHETNGVIDYSNSVCDLPSNLTFSDQLDFDQTICLGQTVYINFYSYFAWNLPNSVSGGIWPYSFSVTSDTEGVGINEYEMSFQPEETSVYEVTVTDAIGQTATKEITITVNPVEAEPIEFIWVGDTGECWAENLTISTTVEYESYSWAELINYDTIVIGTGASQVFGPEVSWSSTYILTVESEGGCPETKLFRLRYFGSGIKLYEPDAEILYDTTSSICEGEEVQFWTNQPFHAYEWTLNDSIVGTTNTLTITAPFNNYKIGLYAYNENDCFDYTTVWLNSTSENTPTISSIDGMLTTDEFNQYQWYLNGEEIPNSNKQSIVPLYEGVYTVGISDNNNGGITSCPSLSESYLFESEVLNMPLNLSVFLEGPYETTTGLMNTDLKDQCLLPINQPYNVEPWFYEGTESLCLPADFSDKTVDWILVEAREGNPNLINPNTTIVETKAAILKEDGKIIGYDNRPLTFDNLVEGASYYIVIRHRNHLDVISSNPIVYGVNNSYDFSTEVSAAFGPEQLKTLADGQVAMYAGDYIPDGIVLNTDFDAWTVIPAAVSVYSQTDGNLDGVIQTTDYDYWFLNKAKLGVIEIRY